MVALLVGTTIFSSCKKDEDNGTTDDGIKHESVGYNRSGAPSEKNTNANTVVGDWSVARFEIPRLNGSYDYICHRLRNRDVNYTMEYDRKNNHAYWVAYTYDSRSAQKNYARRSDAWAADPYFDSMPDIQVAAGQTFPGYNRGHIVGSAERYYSEEANVQTFYMSNMSPMQSEFNSIYWGEVEDKVRDNWGRPCATNGGILYVVKGGTLNDQIGKCPVRSTSGKTLQIAVPRYYWIACLYISSMGTAKAIGFWMEHKDYKNTSNSFLTELRRGAACSIDELERKTGIDFFCNLSDNVENAVEANYNIREWTGL